MNKDFNRMMVSQDEDILQITQLYHPDKNQVTIRQEGNTVRFFPGDYEGRHAAFFAQFNKSGYNHKNRIVTDHDDSRVSVLRKSIPYVEWYFRTLDAIIKIKKHSLEIKGSSIK